jgi:hypothetical protein
MVIRDFVQFKFAADQEVKGKVNLAFGITKYLKLPPTIHEFKGSVYKAKQSDAKCLECVRVMLLFLFVRVCVVDMLVKGVLLV